MSLLFFLWIAVLLAVEFGISGKVSHSDWRLIVTGAMQFHMFVLMFRDEAAVERLVRAISDPACPKGRVRTRNVCGRVWHDDFPRQASILLG